MKNFKFKWKEIKSTSVNNYFFIAKIPKINWQFSVKQNSLKECECSVLFEKDIADEFIILNKKMSIERAKKICEIYFYSFVDKIKKNF
jgi:hypothetical protein